MISVILVDDEVPALEELQYHLSKYPDVSVIDMYSNPMEAIEAIQVKKPDLIFLDIDMPFINGMELALKIQDINIKTEIVFVTAHHEYSLQAFEVHALDYILKPIADERFSKTMARVIKQCNIRNDQSNKSESVFIKCFGKFDIIKNDKNEVLKWRTAKTRELFLYLLCRHDKTITKNELINVLFEGFEEKKAQNNLYVTMFYLKKSLENFGIRAISINENYTLNINPGMCDFIDFMRFIDNDPETYDDEKIEEFENIIGKYKGLYLEEEDYFWAIETREFLDRKYEELSLFIANYYIERNQAKKAINALIRLLRNNPLSEDGSKKILDIYMSQGNDEQYKKFYKEYEKTMQEEFDLEPEQKYSDYYLHICSNFSPGKHM